ncbi:MAG: hypothetical protein ACK443_09320, partial [Methylococcaceae bacterium]
MKKTLIFLTLLVVSSSTFAAGAGKTIKGSVTTPEAGEGSGIDRGGGIPAERLPAIEDLGEHRRREVRQPVQRCPSDGC